MTDPIFILRGVVGSTAHGLATENSDIDTHGVFSWPTDAFWSLTEQPAESIVHTDPDESYHELGKFMKLAAGGNPQMLELLWLTEHIEKEPVWGQQLLDIRKSFLSAKRVQDAYMGYADGQFKKLEARGDSFSSGTRNRTFKHAKHMFRLMEQGRELYETGDLTVKVKDPARYDEYLNMTLDQIKQEFRLQFLAFRGAKSALPEKPNWDLLNDFFFEYRKAHL